MSVLIISRYGTEKYVDWLRHTGEELILLTSDPNEDAYDPRDYLYFERFNDLSSGLVDKKILELYEEYHFRTIIAISESDVLRAAKLRDYLGLSGQNEESALQFRNKVVMKQALQQSDVQVPAFKQLDSPLDLLTFANEHSFPLVVKPLDGAGSIEVVVLRDEQDLQRLLAQPLKQHMLAEPLQNRMVEKFVRGELYHVDGLVLGGEVVLICPSKYFTSDLLSYDQVVGSYVLDASHSLYERLVSATKTVLDTLSTPAVTTFHAEFFHTPDDKLVFCEIASRTGGAKIGAMIEAATGIHLNKEWIQAQVDTAHVPPVPSHHRSAGYLIYPRKNGKLVAVPEACPFPWVTEFEVLAKQGQVFGQEVVHSSNFIASVVLYGQTWEEVRGRLDEANQQLSPQIVWQQ